MTQAALPRHYRRNFWSLAADYCFFGVASTLINPNTVLPSFLTALGAAPVIIGLVSSLHTAAGLIPQLLAARYLGDKPYKKPYILLPAGASRTLLLLLVVLLWATGARPAWLAIAAIALATAGFWAGNALAAVAWLDLISKVIPGRRRGRLFGGSQAVSGLLGLAAGAFVEWMLGERGPGFPHSYTWLYLLGVIMLALSWLSSALAVEEDPTPPTAVPSWRAYLPQLWAVVRRDPAFRRYLIARLFYALSALAMPFYMTFALRRLGLPAGVAGRYTSFGVAGGIAASLVYGWAGERWGSRWVIQAGAALGAAVPLAALILPQLVSDPIWAAWAFGLVFFCLQATISSTMPGWMTYLLQLAPEGQRPLYIGLTNTLNGASTLFSLAGGLLLEWTGGRYGLLFGLTAAGMLVALWLTIRLPAADSAG